MYVKNNLTQTYPAVIHAPDESQLWIDLCDLFFHSEQLRPSHDDSLEIITWDNLGNSVLERCLDLMGLKYHLMGKDMLIWNNLQKFSLNLEVCRQTRSPYLMGLDAHDVLVLRDPSYIVRKFEELDCDILFNCESKFYPNFPIPYYQQNKSFQDDIGGSNKYRYLNSGAWIGKVDCCIEFFEACSKVRIWDLFDCTDNLKLFNCDQSVVHSIFQKFYPRVRLDYGCEIFNNIALIDPREIQVVRLF